MLVFTMRKSLEAHICVLRRFKSIRVYLYLFGLFVGISVKNGNRKSSKGERSECIYPCSFFCCHLAFA